VVTELRRLLPHEDIVYLADTANCPYGPRPAAEIRALAEQATVFLLKQGAKMIVVACNTASAAGLAPLRARHGPALPIVGLVPAVKPAVALTRSGTIGVLATPATLSGALREVVIARFATPAGVRVVKDPGCGLVEAVEADALVLGCTHYPFLRAGIAALVGPSVALVDSGLGVARQTHRLLQGQGWANPGPAPGRLQLYTSGNPAQVGPVIRRLLGKELPVCASWR
jgi:glutamate racemase